MMLRAAFTVRYAGTSDSTAQTPRPALDGARRSAARGQFRTGMLGIFQNAGRKSMVEEHVVGHAELVNRIREDESGVPLRKQDGGQGRAQHEQADGTTREITERTEPIGPGFVIDLRAIIPQCTATVGFVYVIVRSDLN